MRLFNENSGAWFEAVSRFAADEEMLMPRRGTAASAGYDFVVAENIVIPPYDILMEKLVDEIEYRPLTLAEMAALTKRTGAKPTLVSTGIKCHLPTNMYLELSVRSSTPLKHWLIMANSIGIIDADYCNNPDNEGEIFFQMINLSPFPIQLKKGDKIGQGIIKPYEKVRNDNAEGSRQGGFGSTSR